MKMDKHLTEFLIKAKKATYAGKGAEIYECYFHGGLIE